MLVAQWGAGASTAERPGETLIDGMRLTYGEAVAMKQPRLNLSLYESVP